MVVHSTEFVVLFGLQCFHVLFLALHDWVPLGRLNEVRAVRAENPGGQLLRTTLISVAPFAAVLVASAAFLDRATPMWLLWWLWISYLLLFLGELRAWWIPHFFGTTPERVARYEAMFGRTHAVLPARHGIRINTLHVILHAATVATLVVLSVVSAGRGF